MYPKWDVKLDLSVAKTFRINDRFALTGIASLYNLTNRSNIGNIGTNIAAATYRQALWSTGDTYQPRQAQFAFRLQF